MKLFLAFAFLQLADLGTTIGVLSLGGVEKNPIVNHFMGLGTFEGLALAKLIALAIGVLALSTRRYSGLRKLNLAFTAVVVWNLSVIGRLMLA
jgi:hypothetical protein